VKDTSWAHALEVTAGGNGLVGHAGAILLRLLADRTGLTSELDSALALKGTFPLISRGMVLVSTAISITMGATAMAGIEMLGQLKPALGDAPSDSTVRRVLDLASGPVLVKVAQARARVRKRAWKLIEETPGGFPWIAVAGRVLAGWTVIDMDGTLITACSDKENARPAWKIGYGFHPLAAWCINTRECLDMMLRPGNAGSNTFADHKDVLGRALKQVPAAYRRQVLVRVDGAGASHKLVEHLLGLSTERKALLFTCGWTILDASVILSFRVSRVCDLRHPVVDSVADGTLAAWSRLVQLPGSLPDRVRADRWSPSARASWRRSRALSSASCLLRSRAVVSLARSDAPVARWPAGMAPAEPVSSAVFRSRRI
jgi:hypothetical protein